MLKDDPDPKGRVSAKCEAVFRKIMGSNKDLKRDDPNLAALQRLVRAEERMSALSGVRFWRSLVRFARRRRPLP